MKNYNTSSILYKGPLFASMINIAQNLDLYYMNKSGNNIHIKETQVTSCIFQRDRYAGRIVQIVWCQQP